MASLKMKVLITGGLGFIGSHVTEWFVKEGYDVTVIDGCFSYSHREILDGSFKFINADLAQEDAWRLIVDADPEYIIHMAAMTDVDYALANPRLTIENNVDCTLNVFKAAKRLKNLEKLLYVNTDEVYGECEYPKSEEELLFPRNPYSASKAMCSFIRTSFDTSYEPLKDKTAEVRMCNIFGPRQDTRKILPLLLHAVKTGDAIPLQEGGAGYREYLHVSNVAPALQLVLERGNRVFNLTAEECFTVKELIKTVEEITGVKINTFPALRPSMDRWYRMDNSRIKELGWHPEISFMNGLVRYIQDEKVV